MTDRKQAANRKQTPTPAEEHVSPAAMQELKRDMRSAQFLNWARKNSQQLIAGAVVLVVAALGAGYWVEHVKAQRSVAAVIYQQALNSQKTDQKKALLEKVAREYDATGYADLARLQLGRFDDGAPYLQTLADDGSAPDELRWQARLDLAERAVNAGKKDEALSQLKASMGVEYEQLRHYLMARASSGEARIEHLKQAQAEISHDEQLKQKIATMLAEVNAAQ